MDRDFVTTHATQAGGYIILDHRERIVKVSPEILQYIIEKKPVTGSLFSDLFPIHLHEYINQTLTFRWGKEEACKVSVYAIPSGIFLAFHSPDTYKKNHYMELIFQHISNCIIACDRHGKIVLYNRAHAEMDNYNSKEIIGHKISEVYDISEKDSLLYQAMKTREISYARRQTYRTKNGQDYDVSHDVYPLIESGEVVGAFCNTHTFCYAKAWAADIVSNSIQLEHHTNHLLDFTKFQYKSKVMSRCIEKTRCLRNRKENTWVHAAPGVESMDLIFDLLYHSKSKEEQILVFDCSMVDCERMQQHLWGSKIKRAIGDLLNPGIISQANGGTIIFQNLEYMPIKLQKQLYKFIETKRYYPIGSDELECASIRFFTLSSQSVKEAMESENLVPDLVLALSKSNITIPPLSRRQEDVEVLLQTIVKQNITGNIGAKKRIGRQAYLILLSHDWIGNYMEMCNVLGEAFGLLEQGNEIGPEHLPDYLRDEKRGQEESTEHGNGLLLLHGTLKDALCFTERKMIEKALERNDNNLSRAAQELGIHRQNLQYRKKKFGM